MKKTVKVTKCMILVLSVFLTFACSASRPVVKTEEPLRAPLPLEIALSTDRKDGIFLVGEEINLYFVASRDCYLTLLSIGSDGKAKILLPNQYQKDNLAKAGYVYRIPSGSSKIIFKATEPAGSNMIMAIATLNNIPLYDWCDCGTSQTEAKVMDIGRMLSKMREIEQGRWAHYKMAINIIKK